MNWPWNLWSVVYAQIPLFFHTSLIIMSLSKGSNDRMLPENITCHFYNHFSIILKLAGLKCILAIWFIPHTIKLVWAVWISEDLQNSYHYNTWWIGQEQLKKWKKFSWLNMQGCWCFWSCHSCVKLPISMCTKNKNLVSVAFDTKLTVNFMLCSSERNIAKLTLWIYLKFQFA